MKANFKSFIVTAMIILMTNIALCQNPIIKKEPILTSNIDSISYSLGILIGEANRKQMENVLNVDQLNKNIIIEAFRKALLGDSVQINGETANALVRDFFTETPKAKLEEELLSNNESLNRDLIDKEVETVRTNKFIIPEKLWKNECQGMAQNIVIQRLPKSQGSMTVALTKSDASVSILTGNICDMVKGYNNSTLSIHYGRYLIKPCDGSDEKEIEILSQGLEFIYHSGIGLEYKSGKGTIKMLDKSYELTISE